LEPWHLGHNEANQSNLQFVDIASAEGTVLEHQAEFVNALRSNKQRQRLFDAMEQYYAHDFGNGRVGKGFYEQLLLAVRGAGSPEAIEEFETRFSPFLNPNQKHLNADDVRDLEAVTNPELTTAVQDRPRSEWHRVFAPYLPAFLGALIVGLSVIGMTATKRVTAATTPRAKVVESASGTSTQPMQVVGIKPLETAITPGAAEPSHQVNQGEEGEVHFQQAYVHQDGSILADGQNLDLYGVMLIRRDRICASAEEVRWTCGQRAYMALRALLAGRPITCTFKQFNTPPKTVCSMDGQDIAQLLLREGWAELPIDVTEKAYVEASELAHRRGLGIWGGGPPLAKPVQAEREVDGPASGGN
jgi:endonuclease YncB( thermonuclease family)